MSPKLKDKCQHPNKKISSDPVKDDVYSFGVTLYELASIRRPEFDRLDFKRLKDTYPDALLVSLIEQMMD
jgi:serine/threonine protein kinase